MSIDFRVADEPIHVDAGDVFQPVWTFYDENDAAENITGMTFDFIVTDAKTGATVETATCTIVNALQGQVQTRLTSAQMSNLDPHTDYRYRFRALSASEPTTVAKGAFRVSA